MTVAHVRYTGDAGIREISAADFKSLGVEEQGKVTFAGRNLYNPAQHKNALAVVEMSDEAAEALVAQGDFAVVEQSATTTDTADAEASDDEDPDTVPTTSVEPTTAKRRR